MTIETVLAYIAATIIIVAIPGPNVILIINDSVRHGFKKSVLTVCGVKAGIFVLFLISLSGLTALLVLFSSLFTVIKWAGVAYLAYLGITQIVSSLSNGEQGIGRQIKGESFFARGFLVSVTNPKGMLFAGAFFPQFIDEQAAVGPQIVILVGIFLVVSFLIEIGYAYAGDATGRIFSTERFKRLTERLSGAFLIMFGIGLAFVRRE